MQEICEFLRSVCNVTPLFRNALRHPIFHSKSCVTLSNITLDCLIDSMTGRTWSSRRHNEGLTPETGPILLIVKPTFRLTTSSGTGPGVALVLRGILSAREYAILNSFLGGNSETWSSKKSRGKRSWEFLSL